MLDITEATVNFATEFSQTIIVQTTVVDPVTGEETTKPSEEVPTVTRSFVDPGVTVTTSPGTVLISGSYITILPTQWTWLDKNGVSVTDVVPPEVGTYQTIVKVDSPATRTRPCIYTINTDAFTHTVILPSYTPIADKLKSLLAAT